MSRANAALQVYLQTGEKPAAYLGVTSGDHVIQTKAGRIYLVDLVINRVSMCVGLVPAQWKHPPKKV